MFIASVMGDTGRVTVEVLDEVPTRARMVGPGKDVRMGSGRQVAGRSG